MMERKREFPNLKGMKITVDRNAQQFGMFFDCKTNSYWFGEKVKK